MYAFSARNMATHSQMPDERNAYRMQHPYADTHDYVNRLLLVLHCPIRTLNSHLIRTV